MIERAQLKRQAKGYMARKGPSPYAVIAVAYLLTLLISLLQQQVNRSLEIRQAFSQYMGGGSFMDYMNAVQQLSSPSGNLVSLLLTVVGWMVSVGMIIYIMHVVRRGDGSYQHLLDAFAMIWRIICYQVITGILVFFWSLLLIVPGIIAYFRYSQGLYLLIDHPEWNVMDCISASKELMRGHKGEYFLLLLSFLGWGLLLVVMTAVSSWLVVFVFSGVRSLSGIYLLTALQSLLVAPLGVYVTAYINFTLFLYYEALQGIVHDPDVLIPASAPDGAQSDRPSSGDGRRS